MIRLIGIPWGSSQPPKEADCLSLVLYAQKLLWNRELKINADMHWNKRTLRGKSLEIERLIKDYCIRVTSPAEGDIGMIRTLGYCHLFTCLGSNKILHTAKDSTSRISRFDYENEKATYWRVKGGE